MIEDISQFGIPVILISPDGIRQEFSVEDSTRVLAGRVTTSSFQTDINGNQIIGTDPKVILTLKSLVRIPKGDENWIVRIPLSPNSEVFTDHVLERCPLVAESFGTVTLYCTRIEQSS
jgi:hypothetical protein